MTVLTGSLAGPGVAIGVVAAFVGLSGMAASSASHVTGRGNAMLGMLLGLAAIVAGVLAMTGTLPWLASDAEPLARVGAWLEAHVPWLFPS